METPCVLMTFNGEMMCFVHVLLNALEMHGNGRKVRIVLEGAATRLVPELLYAQNPFHAMFAEARDAGLIEGACKACSNKMGVLEQVKAAGIPLLEELKGHPSMDRYLRDGWTVITL